MQAAIIVTVESAFSEGEKGGSSFAGVMVHTRHIAAGSKSENRERNASERGEQ